MAVCTPSSPPSFAAYNTRFLSLSANQQEKLKMKVANVRKLANTYNVLCLLETHASATKLDTLFCRHIDGMRSYCRDGIAVLVQEAWARLHSPTLEVVIPEAMDLYMPETEAIAPSILVAKVCSALGVIIKWNSPYFLASSYQMLDQSNCMYSSSLDRTANLGILASLLTSESQRKGRS